ncbi:PDZ domain-containing protein [Flavobacteriaceae bacterium R38]|nr:PDZ domain-containing protein [Flavobacteriaceae bacterium R38]
MIRLIVLYFLFLPFSSNAQKSFKFSKNIKKETVSFQFINNLIILPIEVNGVELSFILDTGVSKPILFNLADDSLNIKNVKEVFIRGLGEGDAIKAYHSKGNRFKINKIYNNDQDLYVVLDEDIDLSPNLGIPVHGIIGHDFIKDFVLDINYVSKKIKFYESTSYKYKKCKKCEQFDLEIFRDRPYVLSNVTLNDSVNTQVKLLIDSGSSDALWLFEDKAKKINVPKNNFKDFLGRGLSGSIYGERSRVNNFNLGTFQLEDAKVSFPDSVSIRYIKKENNRNGSLGAEILKRFHVILDYNSKKITLRKNANFKSPFKYNMSGIELQHNGIRFVKELESNLGNEVNTIGGRARGITALAELNYKVALHPAKEIAEVREGSPAEIAGLQKGDILVTINNRETYRYSLQEVNELLNEKPGKKIKLTVEREGKELKFEFRLKKVL